MRYADILLMYAESMYETEQMSEQVWNSTIKRLRQRAGFNESYCAMPASGIREAIRNERRVELAWETNRYFDVRRWFIAHGVEGVLNTPVYGLDVSQGKNATDPAFFTMKEGIPRTFRIEHYFAPISATECAFNGELIQAPFY
jgi:hypothetical protein